jgi:small GTP-binding protein
MLSTKYSVPIPEIPPVQYGIRSVRNMRFQSKKKIVPPSTRLVQKVDVTYNYFLKEVDPIISKVITHLLMKQPVNVPVEILEFVLIMKSGVSTDENNTPNNTTDNKSSSPVFNTKPKKAQKIYLATHIGPSIAKLVNRIAVNRPSRVLDFMIAELNQMIHGKGDKYVEDKDVGLTLPIPPKKKLQKVKLGVVTNTESPKSLETNAINIVNTAINTSIGNIQITKSPNRSSPRVLSPRSRSSILNDENVVGDVAEVKNIQILLLGLDGSGKTSMINMLQGKFDTKVKPTIGFRPISMMLGEEYKVKFYDLGGGKKIREIWHQYYHDVHGVIYFVDSSSSEESIKESKELFQQTMSHNFLKNKPLLVLANKQDKSNSFSVDDISKKIDVNNYSEVDKVKISASNTCIELDAVPKDVDDEWTPDVDERLEGSLEWLLGSIKGVYTDLNLRVEEDSKIKHKEEAKSRLNRERKVLRNKICAAFSSQIDPSLLPDSAPPNPEDQFTEDEGIAFLCSEIGVESNVLEAVARELSGLVGYQRLALQIIGALKSPISKKKTPMSWLEIKEIVMELRVELGLSATL